jgi:hypothetical protein
MGSTYSIGQGVSLLSPSASNERYLLDSKLKTAQTIEMAAGQAVTIGKSGTWVEGEPTIRLKTELESKLRATAPQAVQAAKELEQTARLQAELNNKMRALTPLAVQGGLTTVVGAQGSGIAFSSTNARYETKNEELGTRDFEGVSADGTRRTTIIPAGAIGNDRPIEIVYERWFSKELGLVVYSKNTDPRFGEQTYKLINLVRAEPDPALFAMPTGYKVLPAEPTPGYRISTARPADVERVTTERAATRVATPVVYKPKTVEAKPAAPTAAVEKIKP